ncbi:MAG TPA: FAD-dependent oxidoreductase [Pseudonocardia sp.]|jgi:NADH dehydrogenase
MNPKVLVIGAGYAGVSAARRLSRSDARVTLLNPRPEFVERIRLHQLTVGNRDATIPLARLLPTSTELVLGTAETVDAAAHRVRLTDGRTLDYDHLIYAVGSRAHTDVVPGAAEHGVTIGELDGALDARRRLAALRDGAAVTVVGGGLTGVEMATELAEQPGRRVRLVTDGPVAPSVGDRGRDYLRRYLAGQRIELIEHAGVAEIDPAKVLLADGRALDSDLTVLTTSFTLPELALRSGLPVSGRGALLVDPTLACVGAPDIVGAGDGALVDGNPVRMSCQAAIPLGVHAAETVLHRAAGTEPRPLRTRFTGQCISLGRRSALWQRSDSADRPTSFILTGRPGALLKEQICRSTVGIGLNPRLARLSMSWS